MEHLRSDDAEIFYEIRGSGPTVVLSIPFPVTTNSGIRWQSPSESRYRLILPDLRGHGDSAIGEGLPSWPSTQPTLPASSMRRRWQGRIRRLFHWRIYSVRILAPFSRRVTALALCDTRPQPDTPKPAQIACKPRPLCWSREPNRFSKP